MKRFWASILLVLFLYDLVGHTLLFSVLIQQTKTDFFERLENESTPLSIKQFVFPTQDGKITDAAFSWEDDSEFLYQGKMYDVVKKIQSANSIRLYASADERETSLKEMMALFQSPIKSKPLRTYAFWMHSLVKYFTSEIIYLTSPGEMLTLHPPTSSPLLISRHHLPLSPPPKMGC